MNALLKIDKGISYIEKTIMVIAIIIMACVLFANVVGRIVFHHSLTFAEELGTMGTVYVTFVGLSYCARVGEHIAMTAIFDALKGKARKVLMIIIAVVVMAGLAYLGYIALQYIIQLQGQGRTTPILGIKLWAAYIIMPIFIWLAALQYFVILLMNLTDKSGEAITSIEKVTVASVDTEEADEELAEEFIGSLEGAVEIQEEEIEEGGAE